MDTLSANPPFAAWRIVSLCLVGVIAGAWPAAAADAAPREVFPAETPLALQIKAEIAALPASALPARALDKAFVDAALHAFTAQTNTCRNWPVKDACANREYESWIVWLGRARGDGSVQVLFDQFRSIDVPLLVR